jgi:hypothetical protein
MIHFHVLLSYVKHIELGGERGVRVAHLVAHQLALDTSEDDQFLEAVVVSPDGTGVIAYLVQHALFDADLIPLLAIKGVKVDVIEERNGHPLAKIVVSTPYYYEGVRHWEEADAVAISGAGWLSRGGPLDFRPFCEENDAIAGEELEME